MKYEVYIDCSVAGELPFPYDTEADNAKEAGEQVCELADSECALGGVHTVVEVKCCGIETEETKGFRVGVPRKENER